MKLRKKKSNAGRKKLPKHLHQRYENVAVRPDTKKRIVNNADKRNQKIIDYIDEIVE